MCLSIPKRCPKCYTDRNHFDGIYQPDMFRQIHLLLYFYREIRLAIYLAYNNNFKQINLNCWFFLNSLFSECDQSAYQCLSSAFNLLPHANSLLFLPPRHAISHSVSVGSRISRHLQYSIASNHDTCTTG